MAEIKHNMRGTVPISLLMSDKSSANYLIYPWINVDYVPGQLSHISPDKCWLYPRTNM